MSEKQKKPLTVNKARNKSIRITITYFIFGCIWIILTDALTELLAVELSNIIFFNIAKGLFYVLVTAFFVYQLIHSVLKELVDSEERLKESERSKSVLLSNLPGLAYRCSYDRKSTMQFVSDGCFALTGYPSDHLLYNSIRSFNDLIVPEYRESLWTEWELILPQRLPFSFEYEIITATGQRKWVLELGQGIYDSRGKVEALEGIIIDITDRKEYEIMLKHLSEYDSWTGLHNRTYFETILRHDFKRNVHGQNAIVVVNLAIHLLNLTHGFHYAQALLKKISIVLSEYCTDHCQLFHTYTNRFAFYLKRYPEKNDLIAFSQKITRTLESVLFMERIGVGIGIYELNHSETNVEQVLKNVLIASENALNNVERNFSYCFFDAKMESQLLRNEEIKNELSQIAAGEKVGALYLQFQPILDLNSNSIFGFEALARLKSDKLGVISPLEFISIAEKTKLIIPIGKIIISKAFHFLKELKAKGFDANISINISAIQLLRPEFHSDFITLINEMNIYPPNVTLEITESLFSDNYYEINRKLGELRDMGIHIAIDDFGTGYSSLARERELNIDYLKIDKSFIDNLNTLNPEESITGDIISMAHRLGHCVVAEGVENEKQKQYLTDYHCDKIQGYLISKPLSSKQAISLLKERAN